MCEGMKAGHTVQGFRKEKTIKINALTVWNPAEIQMRMSERPEKDVNGELNSSKLNKPSRIHFTSTQNILGFC